MFSHTNRSTNVVREAKSVSKANNEGENLMMIEKLKDGSSNLHFSPLWYRARESSGFEALRLRVKDARQKGGCRWEILEVKVTHLS